MKNVRERHIYCLPCSECGRRVRTLKKKRARDGRCKYCRRGVKGPEYGVNPNQQTLI